MKQIITIIVLLMCSSFGYAQRYNNNGSAAKPKSQASVSKSKQNGTVQRSAASKRTENKLTPPERYPQELSTESFIVNGVSFKMCYVKGGDFLMGATPEQESDERVEKPVHKVHLEDFYIGQTEVTNALWNAVMGTDFSAPNKPATKSYDNCIKFIIKLNSLTGLVFRLPTEEEWEFAARGGNNTQGYKYSGSNYVEDVAWYKYNSGEQLHDVATRQPNELDIFDMSGNVSEFCSDVWDFYDGGNRIDDQITRGGCYNKSDTYCRVASRDRSLGRYTDYSFIGLRLALTRIPPQYREQERQKIERQQQLAREEAQRKKDEENRNALRWDDATKTFYYNGQSYKMVAVEGGTFTMGIPKERKKYRLKDEFEAAKPHKVTLSGYFIGQIEFTRGFYRAILGEKNGFSEDDLLPKGLSWNDCKIIADWLSQFTGKNFCIPSEAEWEFAARGGNRSHGYSMSGCNHSEHTVAPYPGLQDSYYYAVSNSLSNGPNVKVPMKNVASKKPNELDIYDMSGNVWEWCADWYAKYETKDVTNPTGPNTGTMRVYRGGSHVERVVPCVYDRYSDYPDKAYSNIGFRLCLRP